VNDKERILDAIRRHEKLPAENIRAMLDEWRKPPT